MQGGILNPFPLTYDEICHVKKIRVNKIADLVKKLVISTLFYQGGHYIRFHYISTFQQGWKSHYFFTV